MEERLRSLMAELFSLPETDITDELSMKDTAVWDSLTHIELVVSIEQTFGVDLALDDIAAMQTVQDVKRVLQDKGIAA